MHKTLVVTGGSRGIGAATARLAALDGWPVAVVYRSDESAASSVVRSIVSSGGAAAAIKADISIESEVGRLFDEAESKLGGIGALANCAGIIGRKSSVAGIEVDRWLSTFATNVLGTFLCSKESAKRMSSAGTGGAIVNVSSMASVFGAPGEAVDYAASKGAVDSMTVGLAREFAKEKIRVNAVRPGVIDTEFHASAGDPDRPDRLAPAIPMQRVGTPDEVAEAIIWLISDRASYVTGSTITVSGGR